MRVNFDVINRDMIIANGEVVMSRTEEPFLKQVFRKLPKVRPDSVLEVGYGLGISANLIQERLKPGSHHIIEIEDSIFESLKRFASRRSTVRAIKGDWMTFKPRRSYDFVFVDDFVYEMDECCFSGDVDYADICDLISKRLTKLLRPGGIVCILQFNHSEPDHLPDLELIQFEKLIVARYLKWNQSRSTKAGFACWQKPFQSTTRQDGMRARALTTS